LSSPGDFVTVNTGSDWKTMAKLLYSPAWSTAGTGGTTAGTNFGTTDANDFVVKQIIAKL
jgi:hypothetical protein